MESACARIADGGNSGRGAPESSVTTCVSNATARTPPRPLKDYDVVSSTTQICDVVSSCTGYAFLDIEMICGYDFGELCVISVENLRVIYPANLLCPLFGSICRAKSEITNCPPFLRYS